MGLFGWNRKSTADSGDDAGSYKQFGEQVRELHTELAHCEYPRALACKEAALTLHAMADALIGESLGEDDDDIAPQLKQQAETWYGRLSGLIVAARQEAASEGSSGIELPIRLGPLKVEAGPSLNEVVAGLRRAAARMDEMYALSVEVALLQGERFKNVGLLYQSSRTRKEAGDTIAVANLVEGSLSQSTLEDAAKHYGAALADYFLISQGLVYPELFDREAAAAASLQQRVCKLDSDDIWKITSPEAKRDIRRSGEWEEAVSKLQKYWATVAGSSMAVEQREYELNVEDLLANDLIEEDGYRSHIPFPSIYRVKPNASSVQVLGQFIPPEHSFAYAYETGKLMIAAKFQKQSDRHYGDA